MPGASKAAASEPPTTARKVSATPRAKVRGSASQAVATARQAAIVQKARVRTPAVRSIDQKATTAAPQITKGTKGASVRIEACGPRRSRCRRMQTLAASQSAMRKAPPKARVNSAPASGVG